jgi:hypothetical protein
MAYDYFGILSTDEVRKIFEDPEGVRRDYLEKLKRNQSDGLCLDAGSDYSYLVPQGTNLEVMVEEGSGIIERVSSMPYLTNQKYFVFSGEELKLRPDADSQFRIRKINSL